MLVIQLALPLKIVQRIFILRLGCGYLRALGGDFLVPGAAFQRLKPLPGLGQIGPRTVQRRLVARRIDLDQRAGGPSMGLANPVGDACHPPPDFSSKGHALGRPDFANQFDRRGVICPRKIIPQA